MKRMQQLLITLLILALCVSLIACGGKQKIEKQVTETNPEEAISEAETAAGTIALVPPAMISPYYASVIKGAKEGAERLGYELLTLAPESESDYAAQVQIVEDMITKNVDGIILCAINADAIISAVKKANDADIPVIMFNTQNELADGEVACYVRYDQYEGGAKVCDFVAEIFNGEANVGIIEGLPSDHTTERAGGFQDRAAEKYPGIKIVASQPGDWEREKGMNAATNMLQANPEIDAFFGLSDEMALGAVKAVQQAGADAKVFGFDGNPNAVSSILAEELVSTLSIGGVPTGDEAIVVMDKILKGETVEKFVLVETEIISLENADQFPSE